MKYTKYFDKKLNRWLWRFDFTLHGRRIRESGFPLKSRAEDFAAKIRLTVLEERYGMPKAQPGYTLSHLLAKRKADSDEIARHQPLETFGHFVDFIGEHVALRDLTTSHIKKYLAELQSRDLKPSSIQTYLNQIYTALNNAGEYFPRLEWRPPKFPRVKADPGRDRVLTAAEIGKIITALRSDRIKYESEKGERYRQTALDLFRLALLIPARRGELLALTVNDINLDWHTITIRPTKVKEMVRAIPLSRIALEILRFRWPPKAKGKKFFASYTPKQLITSLEKASQLSGVEYGDQVEGGYVFHDLRHTAATIMASSGIDHATLAAVIGHKHRDMTSRYIHPSLDSQRKAIQALEDFCLKIPGFIEQKPAEQSRAAVTGI